MKFKIATGLLTLTLLGCVSMNGSFVGVDEDTPEGVTNLVEKKFIGIPLVLGMEGNAVRLNSEWMITAKHNNLLIKETLISHPECDVAVYRDYDPSYGQTPTGLLYEEQDAFVVGYPPTPFPLTSQKGNYLGEVDNLSWKGDCLFSALDASAVSGMSGSGVFSDKGELVGITHAVMDSKVTFSNGEKVRPTLFLPLLRVKDWLYETTGVKLGENK
ncbi:hypothetical protein VPBG_00040 [Vibrio phage helene 12B3]|uniref:protease n=1 Tax=Vibrio phage helene 12B3 TaxID=573173 RepID=UPI0002C09CC2|nr:protease [Vibrio phage helene 12B3]AGG57812.1 hypothetical protein VPBG_00040 [Vibrio phage helene 12B3]